MTDRAIIEKLIEFSFLTNVMIPLDLGVHAAGILFVAGGYPIKRLARQFLLGLYLLKSIVLLWWWFAISLKLGVIFSQTTAIVTSIIVFCLSFNSARSLFHYIASRKRPLRQGSVTQS